MPKFNKDITVINRTKVRKIIANVNHFYGVNCLDNTRKRDIVVPRQIAMYYAVRETNLTLTSVGLFFNKDHATVIHAMKCVENTLSYNKEFQKQKLELDKDMFKLNFKTKEELKRYEVKENICYMIGKLDLEQLQDLQLSLS
jgi:chromosomal replication initiator protein